MATPPQPSSPTPAAPAQPCPTCGAAMAADQRYCLSCGTRRGEPRVPVAENGDRSAPVATAARTEPAASRPADVSPLAAVIGIALLGGMLLIGVLIGRGDTSNDQPPAPVVQVGDQTATTESTTTTAQDTSTTGSGSDTGSGGTAVTSEWPEGTEGFTVQLSTLPKQGTTADAVDAAKNSAKDAGLADAAVLDSDLYPSLPPDTYVIYSGVYTGRKGADKALTGGDLLKSFPSAIVVEVSSKASARPAPPESEVPPPVGGGKTPTTSSGGTGDPNR